MGLLKQTVPETIQPQCIGKRQWCRINVTNNAERISAATRHGFIHTGNHKETVRKYDIQGNIVVDLARRYIKPESMVEAIERQRVRKCIPGRVQI